MQNIRRIKNVQNTVTEKGERKKKKTPPSGAHTDANHQSVDELEKLPNSPEEFLEK